MKKLSKKSALLFAAVMALAAFAMPSLASAHDWTINGSAITSTVTVTTHSAAMTLAAPAISQSVTCPVDDHGTISPGGVDSITSFVITTASCSTTISPACTLTATPSTASPTNPWPSILGTDGSGNITDTISNVGFSDTFDTTGNCGPFGGLTLDAAGTITGQVVGNGVVFNNTAGLMSPQVGPVLISGTDTLTSAAGTVGAS